jgi:hypothetical protein
MLKLSQLMTTFDVDCVIVVYEQFVLIVATPAVTTPPTSPSA